MGGVLKRRMDRLDLRSQRAVQVITGSNDSSSDQQSCCVKDIAYGWSNAIYTSTAGGVTRGSVGKQAVCARQKEKTTHPPPQLSK